MNEAPILFVLFDDLASIRRRLTGFGYTALEVAPNLTRFGNRWFEFRDAHCASPTCHASRVAMMSGLHPIDSGILNSSPEMTYSRSKQPLQWIQAWFRQLGWEVGSAGKVFHESDDHDDPPDVFDWVIPQDKHPRPHGAGLENFHFGPSRDEQADGLMVAKLLARHSFAPRSFVCAGFKTPHVPLAAPARYFARFELDRIIVPRPGPEPVGLARRFMSGTDVLAELRESGRMPELIRAYLASVAYVDDQFGALVDAAPDDCRIVVTSDHGWSLGEFGSIKKGEMWPEATGVPLYVKAPGLYPSRGDDRNPFSLTRIPELLKGLVTDTPVWTSPSSVAEVAFDIGGVSARAVYGREFLATRHVAGDVVEDGLFWREDDKRRDLAAIDVDVEVDALLGGLDV